MTGRLFVIISPSEATTMVGRCRRGAAELVVKTTGQVLIVSATDPIVLFSELANTYAHYMATPKEYDVQRYEDASTLFRP